VQRLLGEVFVWGLEDFQRYCRDEPDWQAAVQLLDADDGAGWELLRDMCAGSAGASELAASRFCAG
jgi:hypothetical protein